MSLLQIAPEPGLTGDGLVLDDLVDRLALDPGDRAPTLLWIDDVHTATLSWEIYPRFG